MSREPSQPAFALREEIDTALAERSDYSAWSPTLVAAHEAYRRNHEFALLRFQLMISLMISGMAMIWDLIAVPEKADVAIAWRLLTNAPLALVGFLVLYRRHIHILKWILGLSLISMGMLSMHLASFGSAEAMARYSMATSFVLGLSCVTLPYPPEELKRYALGFALATILTGLWPNSLPAGELSLYITFTAMVGIPGWAIARRQWQLNARAFLLDMRDEATRQELEQNNELLRQLSEQDPLTGMPNRRQFERVVSERVQSLPKALAETTNLAVMMIDLDHFKTFNDRHGHQAGDRCLVLAAAQLQAVFPQDYGILARYGGEEFIAALRERVPGEAARLAEEMRMAIEEMLVPVRDNSEPLITTSIGLALASANARLDLEDLIEMADVALYSAKREGRNRVEIIDASVPSQIAHETSGEGLRA